MNRADGELVSSNGPSLVCCLYYMSYMRFYTRRFVMEQFTIQKNDLFRKMIFYPMIVPVTFTYIM